MRARTIALEAHSKTGADCPWVRSIERVLGVTICAAITLFASSARGAIPPETAPTQASLNQDGERRAVIYAQWLLDHERSKEALVSLKEQTTVHPHSRSLQLLLGIAYLRNQNPFWGIRVLAGLVESDANDCEARVWLAWSQLQTATPDDAEASLGHASCEGPGPMAARAAIMRTYLYHTRAQDNRARTELGRARAAERAFDSDREALTALSEKIAPERIPELAWQLDVRQGYTTNALLGSPIDPAAMNVSTASSFLQTNTWVRFAPDLRLGIRPSLEVQARVFQLFDKNVKDQSYINPTGRVGVYLSETIPRVLIGYRPDYLRLNAGDTYDKNGPLWYVGGHRAEVEVEATPSVLAFVGAGKRDFRNIARNRTELDGGLGGQSQLAPGLALLWAVSGRKHWTSANVYNLIGTTALGNLQYTFGPGWQTRLGLTLAADWYPDSRNYFDGPEREDKFVKGSCALFSPTFMGLRTGFSYDYSHRDSSAKSYVFDDHRVTMIIAWSGRTDLSGPSRTSSRPLADVPWGLGSGQGLAQERIQELLRQDEQTLQRSCGCRE